jgi:hypothetical protein
MAYLKPLGRHPRGKNIGWMTAPFQRVKKKGKRLKGTNSEFTFLATHLKPTSLLPSKWQLPGRPLNLNGRSKETRGFVGVKVDGIGGGILAITIFDVLYIYDTKMQKKNGKFPFYAVKIVYMPIMLSAFFEQKEYKTLTIGIWNGNGIFCHNFSQSQIFYKNGLKYSSAG